MPITISGNGTVTGISTFTTSNVVFTTFSANTFTGNNINVNSMLAVNAGFGSTSNTYGCRAWANFNTNIATITIRASGHISSVTDNGTGDYTVNFTSAFANAYYTVAGTSQLDNVGQSNYNTFVAVPRRSGAQATGSCRVVSEYPAGVALYDAISFRVEFVAA